MCKRKKCLNCEEVVIGRADKKFCGVECKTDYHNGRFRDSNNFMRKVNRTLKTNRIILRRLYERGRTRVRHDMLVDLGYQFTYFTHVCSGPAGRQYNFCYEQGIQMMDNGHYRIVSRADIFDMKPN